MRTLSLGGQGHENFISVLQPYSLRFHLWGIVDFHLNLWKSAINLGNGKWVDLFSGRQRLGDARVSFLF